MKITLVAGGLLKSGPLKSLFQDYEKRLSWKIDVKEIPENAGSKTTKLFIDKIPKGSVVIALDETGDNLSSASLAQFIQTKQVSGTSHFCFLIGTADGFSPEIHKHTHKKISFGAATWPHPMVRTLLMEQLYRAQQIIAGHPYHRG